VIRDRKEVKGMRNKYSGKLKRQVAEESKKERKKKERTEERREE
jgi:hypothetical protein